MKSHEISTTHESWPWDDPPTFFESHEPWGPREIEIAKLGFTYVQCHYGLWYANNYSIHGVNLNQLINDINGGHHIARQLMTTWLRRDSEVVVDFELVDLETNDPMAAWSHHVFFQRWSSSLFVNGVYWRLYIWWYIIHNIYIIIYYYYYYYNYYYCLLLWLLIILYIIY